MLFALLIAISKLSALWTDIWEIKSTVQAVVGVSKVSRRQFQEVDAPMFANIRSSAYSAFA